MTFASGCASGVNGERLCYFFFLTNTSPANILYSCMLTCTHIHILQSISLQHYGFHYKTCQLSGAKSHKEATQPIVVMWPVGRGVWLIYTESDTSSLQAVKLKIFQWLCRRVTQVFIHLYFTFTPHLLDILVALSGHFHLENAHINQVVKLCKLAKFSLVEMKIPREAMTEPIVTRSTLIRVATYYPEWLAVCWSPSLCECANMMWFSSSVKAQLHAVWLILASSNPQTAVCRLLPLPHSPQLFPAPNC